MSRFGDTSSDDGTDGGIDISPLIDCVFILLIFFIVTTVFVEEPGVEVNKTRVVTARDLERTSILIAVTENGDVVHGGRSIGVSGVQPLVKRALQKDRDDPIPVIIQADTRTDAGPALRVAEEAKLAGAVDVSFATKIGG